MFGSTCEPTWDRCGVGWGLWRLGACRAVPGQRLHPRFPPGSRPAVATLIPSVSRQQVETRPRAGWGQQPRQGDGQPAVPGPQVLKVTTPASKCFPPTLLPVGLTLIISFIPRFAVSPFLWISLAFAFLIFWVSPCPTWLLGKATQRWFFPVALWHGVRFPGLQAGGSLSFSQPQPSGAAIFCLHVVRFLSIVKVILPPVTRMPSSGQAFLLSEPGTPICTLLTCCHHRSRGRWMLGSEAESSN